MYYYLLFFIILLLSVIIEKCIYIYKLYNLIKKYYNNIYLSSNIYIKKSNQITNQKYNRGVFANKDFNKNDIIEIAPSIEDNNYKKSILKDYVFTDKNKTVIGFGYSSLYNHSNNFNANWKIADDYILITAVKDIKKDEEIFTDYGNGYWISRFIKPT